MFIERMLLAAIALTCAAAATGAPLAPQETTPAYCDASSQDCEVLEQPEKAPSLAQTTWARTKVPFSKPYQSSCGTVLRVVLAALLFMSAIVAYSGMPQAMAEVPILSAEHPRRLASAFLQSLSSQTASSQPAKEAARLNIAKLRIRGLRHRLVRLDEGDDGLLDDDRDSAQIQGLLSRAKAYSQHQQFEKADAMLQQAVSLAEGVIEDMGKDSHGKVEKDDAEHQASEVLYQIAEFYLERGHTHSAERMLEKVAPIIAKRTDTIAMRCRLLTANVKRDAGRWEAAVSAYHGLLQKISAEQKQAGPAEHATLEEIASETRGEYGRALLSEGKVLEARELLEDTLKKLVPADHKASQGPSSLLLASRLKGWLAFAFVKAGYIDGSMGGWKLKEGKAAKAIDLLDEALAGIGELPTGIAGATAEFQEFMQTRAMAKVALGKFHNAAEDLEVVRELQNELKKTIIDGHNPKYSSGEGRVPDARLWVSMARTRAIAADIKLQSKVAGEALSLAKEARQLLREAKSANGRMPKGYQLATFAEVKDLVEKAKAQSKFLSKRSASDNEHTDNDASDTAEHAVDEPGTKVFHKPTQVPAASTQGSKTYVVK